MLKTYFRKFRSLLIACALVASLVFMAAPPDRARASGTVSSCTESALNTALTGGGPVTITCDGIITFTSTKTIAISTVISASNHQVILDGGSSVRMFSVNPGISLTLQDLTLQNAFASSGSVVSMVSGGNLVIENSRFLNNIAATDFGGAIYADVIPGGMSSTVTIRRSLFEGNGAGLDGGVIYIDGGQTGTPVNSYLNISDSTFRNNQANIASNAAHGGAIFANYDITTNIEGTIFEGNQAGNDGGALYSMDANGYRKSGQ